MPPARHGYRKNLQDLRFLHRVPLSSVGGTMLLVDANLHRSGLPAVAVLAFLAMGLVAGGNFAAAPLLNASPRDQALANGAMAQPDNIGTFSATPLLALVAGSLSGWPSCRWRSV